MQIKIAPSILAADFSNLEKEIKKVEAAGADFIHIDVMDGNFVPNITIGPCVVKDIRKVTKLPLEAHLMIKRPERFVDDFIKAGADMLTVHIETISASRIIRLRQRLRRMSARVLTTAEKNLRHKTWRIRQEFWRKKSKLKTKGIKLGVSLNPSTPLAKIKGVLDSVDFVLVMTVDPGFSGQKFMPEVIPKIKKLREIYKGDIAVDGGINDTVASDLINAGANILAAATFIFDSGDYRRAIERLRNA